MNSTVRKEPTPLLTGSSSFTFSRNIFADPDPLFDQALEALGNENDSQTRQLKTLVFKNSDQAKQLVCSTICNCIETLKDRRDTLCEEIDQLTFQILKDDNFSRYRVTFATDDLLARKLQNFGSIKVEKANENELINCNRKMTGMDAPSHPLNIEAQKASPESSGSVDSFDIIDESDFENKSEKAIETKAPKPLVPRFDVRDALYGGIAMHFSRPSAETKEEPVLEPAHLIANQLSYFPRFHYDVDFSSSQSNKMEDSSCASPSSILKQKFKEFSCCTYQAQWLSPSYRK